MGIKAVDSGVGKQIKLRLDWLAKEDRDLNFVLGQLRADGPDYLAGEVMARIKAVHEEQDVWVGWLAMDISDDTIKAVVGELGAQPASRRSG